MIPFFFLINSISSRRLGSDRKICFQREGRENVFLFFLPPYIVLFQTAHCTKPFLKWENIQIRGTFPCKTMLLSWQHKFRTGKCYVGCSTDSMRCTGRWTEWEKPFLPQRSHQGSLCAALAATDLSWLWPCSGPCLGVWLGAGWLQKE